MNDFKNVKSFHKYEFDLDEEDFPVIKSYLKKIQTILPKQEYVLYNYYQGIIPFSSPDIYSKKLKKLLKNKFEKDLTMNDIRRSYESELINSDRYKSMTNEQQKKNIPNYYTVLVLLGCATTRFDWFLTCRSKL